MLILKIWEIFDTNQLFLKIKCLYAAAVQSLVGNRLLIILAFWINIES